MDFFITNTIRTYIFIQIHGRTISEYKKNTLHNKNKNKYW